MHLLKRLSIACWLLIALTQTVKAQGDFVYTQKADSMFLNLDKAAITSDILFDRAFPVSRFDLFNNSMDTSNYEFALQAYSELYQAHYQRNKMTHPDVLTDMVTWENLRNRIPIQVLDYNIHKLRPDAVEQNLLTYSNGVFHHVPGAASPYQQQTFQAAKPLVELIKTPSVKFVLMPHFISRNTGLSVASVQINGGGVNITLTGPLDSASVTFSSGGKQELTLVTTLSNGSSFTTVSSFYIGENQSTGRTGITGRVTAEAPPPCKIENLEGTIPWQGYDETEPFKGMFTLSYYYRLNDPNVICGGSSPVSLRKPVIMIDGYDPTDKRTADDRELYSEFLYYWDDVNFNPPQQEDFVEKIRDLGYDVILVDIPTYFHTSGGQIIPLPENADNPPPGYDYYMGKIIRGGGDYVERNGMTFISLIRYINQQLIASGSAEELVIVGPSMGGQITRFALKTMENNNEDHNCRLWISQDSNHEGA